MYNNFDRPSLFRPIDNKKNTTIVNFWRMITLSILTNLLTGNTSSVFMYFLLSKNSLKNRCLFEKENSDLRR